MILRLLVPIFFGCRGRYSHPGHRTWSSFTRGSDASYRDYVKIMEDADNLEGYCNA